VRERVSTDHEKHAGGAHHEYSALQNARGQCGGERGEQLDLVDDVVTAASDGPIGVVSFECSVVSIVFTDSGYVCGDPQILMDSDFCVTLRSFLRLFCSGEKPLKKSKTLKSTASILDEASETDLSTSNYEEFDLSSFIASISSK
jgi:hypothetical protein